MMDQDNAVIQMHNVRKEFSVDNGFFTKGKRTVKAVNDVTINIRRGEILGLVGESGSGKTTLARVILNLTKLTGGTVLVDGVDISKASAAEKKAFRRKVAVMFQKLLVALFQVGR